MVSSIAAHHSQHSFCATRTTFCIMSSDAEKHIRNNLQNNLVLDINYSVTILLTADSYGAAKAASLYTHLRVSTAEGSHVSLRCQQRTGSACFLPSARRSKGSNHSATCMVLLCTSHLSLPARLRSVCVLHCLAIECDLHQPSTRAESTRSVTQMRGLNGIS